MPDVTAAPPPFVSSPQLNPTTPGSSAITAATVFTNIETKKSDFKVSFGDEEQPSSGVNSSSINEFKFQIRDNFEGLNISPRVFESQSDIFGAIFPEDSGNANPNFILPNNPNPSQAEQGSGNPFDNLNIQPPTLEDLLQNDPTVPFNSTGLDELRTPINNSNPAQPAQAPRVELENVESRGGANEPLFTSPETPIEFGNNGNANPIQNLVPDQAEAQALPAGPQAFAPPPAQRGDTPFVIEDSPPEVGFTSPPVESPVAEGNRFEIKINAQDDVGVTPIRLNPEPASSPTGPDNQNASGNPQIEGFNPNFDPNPVIPIPVEPPSRADQNRFEIRIAGVPDDAFPPTVEPDQPPSVGVIEPEDDNQLFEGAQIRIGG